MKTKAIKGFKALKFKEEAQARVQAELAGLSAEEEVRKLNEMAMKGPFADLIRKWRAAKRAEMKAALDREEQEEAA